MLKHFSYNETIKYSVSCIHNNEVGIHFPIDEFTLSNKNINRHDRLKEYTNGIMFVNVDAFTFLFADFFPPISKI